MERRKFTREFKVEAVKLALHPGRRIGDQRESRRVRFRKHVAIIPCLAINDAIGVQADAGNGRREQIAAAQAPQKRSGQTRENASDEEWPDPRKGTRGPLLTNLVKMTELKTALWQIFVERRHAKRHDQQRRTITPLETWPGLALTSS